MRAGSSRLLPALTLALLIGCSPESTPTGTDDPAFSHTGIPDISGRVFLGNGQRNICSGFADGSLLIAQAFAIDGSSANAHLPACPDNNFSIPVEPGSYLLRLRLPADQPLGELPQRWLEPVPLDVDVADVLKDIHVRAGSPLGGRVTVDGLPRSGVNLTALYGSLPFAGAAFGVSDATGGWADAFGRPRLILQENIEYIFSGCLGLPAPGIKEVTGFPAGPVVFPGGTNEVSCHFITGDALRYTHRATRLKLSSFPGDIGGLSDPIIFPDLGYGYSAQFPLAPGEAPLAGPHPENRQIFRGGLVLGIAPDVVLSGTELEGYVSCSVSPCRAFGFDGEASVREGAGGSKEITWTYTDAGSQRPQGLRVVQRSFDGRNGGDYVLYAFRITNSGTTAVTFTPGLFLDFDVGAEFFTNVGYTELDGQLMITTAADDTGPHLGSVIVESRPVRRSYFANTFGFLQESEVVAALRGEISNPTLNEPSDIRALQGGNTVKLGRGKSADFWVAIVAGDDRVQTIANARAALADGAARRSAGNPFATAMDHRVPVRSLGPAARAAATARSTRICKTGCGPD